MKNSWLIAMREFRERIGSRSFVLMSVIGPLVVLGFVYALFVVGGEKGQRWNVLIADPGAIMENKILASEDANVRYSFADGYIEHDEFADAKKYQQFDALIEINEKVLSNKAGHIFYRNEPTTRMQIRVRYHCERRLEEVMVKEFTDLTIDEYRKIKQPINFAFHDVYDPNGVASDLSGWVGFFFGALIFVFIFLFGMTILRSVSREKSNRIVEVLLASVSPNQLMTGKIIGVGITAFLQFAVWMVIIGAGLYFMRESLFPDMLDASNLNIQELSLGAENQSYQERFFAAKEYNEFVTLVYERIQFSNMIGFFLLFFIAGYLFYGSLFAALGATMGSESDGQQFVLPLIFVLCFALYAGYYALNYPDALLTSIFHYLPFTAPVVVMVKLSQGYEPGHAYEIILSLLTLIASAFIVMAIAARLYRNGILQFGHRLRLKHLFKWLKNT